jgi:hypothetical protein
MKKGFVAVFILSAFNLINEPGEKTRKYYNCRPVLNLGAASLDHWNIRGDGTQ